MKKTAVYLLLFVLLLASCTGGNKAENSSGPTDSVPVMVMHIRKCSKLYTAEYKVRKIVTHDDKVELNGSFLQQKFNISVPMSSRKIAIPIDAKLKAYVDFSGFSEKNIRTDNIARPQGRTDVDTHRAQRSEEPRVAVPLKLHRC